LRVLRDAFRPDEPGGVELVHQFYSHWFALDVSVRDLFPPEMAAQRAAFGQALHWVYGELLAQRAAEPVAFLAQLGRDHRKYGVLPTHYEALRRALYATLRTRLGDAWTAAVDAAAGQSLNLIIGVMSGAADADEGLALEGVEPMENRGRKMPGWVFVAADVLRDEESLDDWVERSLTFVATLPNLNSPIIRTSSY